MVKGVLIYNYRQRWKKYADMHEFFADMLNTNIIDINAASQRRHGD